MTGLLPTNQIWRYHHFETFLRDVEVLGVHDIDLWLCNQHVNIDAHDIYNLADVKAACERHGVRVSTLTPEQSNPKAYNIASDDGRVLELTGRYYAQVLRLAGELGCGRVSMNAGWFLGDGSREEAWDRMVRAIGTICDMAAADGVTVCVEPLTYKPWRLVCTMGDMKRLVGDVGRENLYVTVDTGTVVRNGELVESYLETFGRKIGYCHLTNCNPAEFAHLGWADDAGTLDGRQLLSMMRTHGYRGDYALEMTCSRYFQDPTAVLARSLGKLKGCGN